MSESCCEHCRETAEEVKRLYEGEYDRGRREAYEAVLHFMDHGEPSPNAGASLSEVIERLKDFEVGVSEAVEREAFAAGVRAMRSVAVAQCQLTRRSWDNDSGHYANAAAATARTLAVQIDELPDPEPQ